MPFLLTSTKAQPTGNMSSPILSFISELHLGGNFPNNYPPNSLSFPREGEENSTSTFQVFSQSDFVLVLLPNTRISGLTLSFHCSLGAPGLPCFKYVETYELSIASFGKGF